MNNNGVKKAATFLSGLDCKTVDLLMRRLDPETAAAVRRELLTMQKVSPREIEETAGDFMRNRMPLRKSGVASDGRTTVLKRFPERVDSIDTVELSSRAGESCKEGKFDKPFGFLQEAETRPLLETLMSERPQTIALVLTYIPPETAAAVLRGFPVPLQAETARAMHELEEIDAEILKDIEEELRERFSIPRETPKRRRIGSEALAKILRLSDSEMEKTILSNLGRHEREGKRPVREERLTFEGLRKLRDGDLALLFASVDRRIGMIALVGADPVFIERIVGRYTTAQQRHLRQQLAVLGPIRTEDIEEARRLVVKEAARLIPAVEDERVQEEQYA